MTTLHQSRIKSSVFRNASLRVKGDILVGLSHWNADVCASSQCVTVRVIGLWWWCHVFSLVSGLSRTRRECVRNTSSILSVGTSFARTILRDTKSQTKSLRIMPSGHSLFFPWGEPRDRMPFDRKLTSFQVAPTVALERSLFRTVATSSNSLNHY